MRLGVPRRLRPMINGTEAHIETICIIPRSGATNEITNSRRLTILNVSRTKAQVPNTAHGVPILGLKRKKAGLRHFDPIGATLKFWIDQTLDRLLRQGDHRVIVEEHFFRILHECAARHRVTC